MKKINALQYSSNEEKHFSPLFYFFNQEHNILTYPVLTYVIPHKDFHAYASTYKNNVQYILCTHTFYFCIVYLLFAFYLKL